MSHIVSTRPGSRVVQVCVGDQSYPLAIGPDGYVIAAPPVAGWMVDRPESQIVAYVAWHGGEIRPVNETVPIPG
jgi:hypothetical protein